MGYAARAKKRFNKQPHPLLGGGIESDVYRELKGRHSVRSLEEQEQFKKYLATIKDQITEQALDYMIVIVMNALHDEFGFGVKRCQQAFDKINRIAACVNVTVSWDELTRFMACDFDERKYEKLYGPRSQYDVEEADKKMRRIIRLVATDDLYQRLDAVAEKKSMTVNQLAIKALANVAAGEWTL